MRPAAFHAAAIAMSCYAMMKFEVLGSDGLLLVAEIENRTRAEDHVIYGKVQAIVAFCQFNRGTLHLA